MVMWNAAWGAVLVELLISTCARKTDAVAPPRGFSPSLPVDAAAPPTRPALLELQKQTIAVADAETNAHDAKSYSQLFTPDATLSEYGVGQARGRQAIGRVMQSAFDGFPDFTIGVSKIFVKDEVVVREWVITGTQKGEFAGAKPTNKRMGVRGADVLTFTPEGLIRRARCYLDTSTLLSQLGVMKTPARPAETLPSGDPEWHVAKGTPEEDRLVEASKALDRALETKSEADFLRALSNNPLWTDLASPRDMSGTASAKQFFSTFTAAFPDAIKTYETLFAADDTVISASWFTAKHAGRFGPLKPTKKPVTFHLVDITSFKNGKVVSGSTYSNSLEVLGPEGYRPKR
jgi:steroid delta-isomerase-like uncharacterized protein